MSYIYRLAAQLGFITDEDALYYMVRANVRRAKRRGTLDRSILDVLDSGNNTE